MTCVSRLTGAAKMLINARAYIVGADSQVLKCQPAWRAWRLVKRITPLFPYFVLLVGNTVTMVTGRSRVLFWGLLLRSEQHDLVEP